MDIEQMIKLTSIVDDPVKTHCDCSMPVAFERSDEYKDWLVFKYFLLIDRDFFLRHLEMTKEVFDYNVLKLPQDQQDDLLGRGSTAAPRPSS